ncbi:MAG: hypothetical protein ACYDDZ_03515 [Acidimicrobiales bacterium]
MGRVHIRQREARRRFICDIHDMRLRFGPFVVGGHSVVLADDHGR